MIIYKTTNLINGKIYIGKDEKNKKSYLGSGIVLVAAFLKYGKENFIKEIVEKCSKANICEKEIFWIKKLKSQNPVIGYNLTKGGDGGRVKGCLVSQKKREKIRAALLDRTHTEQRKNNISNSLKGRVLLQKHRNKISRGIRNSIKYELSREKLIGQKHTPEHNKKISESLKKEKNPFWNKKHTPESKQKMAEKKFIFVSHEIVTDVLRMRLDGRFYRQIKEKHGFSVTKIKSILKQGANL